jgi:eukaryotic-like serine/threonine-protein kinase
LLYRQRISIWILLLITLIGCGSQGNGVDVQPSIPLQSTPTPNVGSTMIGKDGMTMLYVPAGEFKMGSEIGENDQKPVHMVYLYSFWIDQTEVTNAMYAKCVKGGKCNPPRLKKSYTHDSYYDNSEFDKYPVIYVSWSDAKAYCEWVDSKLPTEAEWEKAARGDNAHIYPWGNESPTNNLLNYNDAVGDVTEVGKYPNGASLYGALDMAGNVWEWVSSLYQPYPYSGIDGREDLSAAGSRVLRGGAWSAHDVGFIHSASRYPLNSAYSNFLIGFRCSHSP